MKKLQISPALALPPEAVTQTVVVYGAKGMGKTNFGSVFAEEMYAANLRFSVIDPMGVWWGLQHGSLRGDPGLEVLILGGVHGDLPIEPTGGEVVADLVADEAISVVVDISRRPDGKAWSKGEKVRFVTAYMTRLYERQVEHRRPLMQIIDEAARYAPQGLRSGDVDESKCLGAIAMICEEGRNLGIGLTLLTQRSARLNKDVAELADVLVAFRTVGPNSVGAITDWLGDHVARERHKAIVEQLRQLPVGTALVISPGWLGFEGVVPVRARETFDSSATPKTGHALVAPGKASKPDLDKYRERMAATIERAKENDPKELKRRLAEAKRELAARDRQLAARQASAVTAETQTVEVPVIPDEQIDRFERAVVRLEGVRSVLADVKDALEEAENIRQFVLEGVRRIRAAKEAPVNPQVNAPTPRATPLPPRRSSQNERKRAPAARGNDGGITGVAQKILDTLAEFEAMGVGRVPKVQAAFMAGYSNLNSKSFANALGSLRSGGFVTYPDSDTLAFTDAGRAQATPAQAPLTTADVQQRISELLGKVHRGIVDQLIAAYPGPVKRSDLAGACGYSNVNSKSFANALGRLRTLGFVDYQEAGEVVATELLFPEGLR